MLSRRLRASLDLKRGKLAAPLPPSRVSVAAPGAEAGSGQAAASGNGSGAPAPAPSSMKELHDLKVCLVSLPWRCWGKFMGASASAAASLAVMSGMLQPPMILP